MELDFHKIYYFRYLSDTYYIFIASWWRFANLWR